MKTIGLLGGTGWLSTIEYYRKINQLVAERLGGYHSANIILKSIDYHRIMINYGKNPELIAEILFKEVRDLINLRIDCIMICCNSLHKYFDLIEASLNLEIPVLHAVKLVAKDLHLRGLKRVLLLATKATMEDGFFADTLRDNNIIVKIPDTDECEQMHLIHLKLMQNHVEQKSRDYFSMLTKKYQELDAVILGCTEYPLILDKKNSALRTINPVDLQAKAAVDYALG